MDYGVNFNASYVMNGDDIELGIHATDSDGVDVSTKVNGDNINDVVAAAMEDIMNGVQEQKAKKINAVDDVTRLKEQNARLQARVEQLQKELDVKKVSQTATPVKSSKDTFEKKPIREIDTEIYERAKDKTDKMMDNIDDILRDLFAANSEELPEKKKEKPARKQSWHDVKYQMKDSDCYPRTLWF